MLDNFIFCSVFKKGVFKIVATTINVEDKIYTGGLCIYPNPTSDYIIINPRAINPKFNLGVDDVHIYNTLGEKVLSVVAGSNLPVRINISNLPKGMYFVKADGETTKFMKM